MEEFPKMEMDKEIKKYVMCVMNEVCVYIFILYKTHVVDVYEGKKEKE